MDPSYRIAAGRDQVPPAKRRAWAQRGKTANCLLDRLRALVAGSLRLFRTALLTRWGCLGRLLHPASVPGYSETQMASNTAVTSRRRVRNHKKAGRDRKRQESRRSTLTAAELFAALGEPGKPAPKTSQK